MTRLATSRRRPGFTLIELLVVLLIIGILIGLLVPALAAAIRRARSAAVQAEINQLAQALNDFKSKFGDYPPSRILIQENGFTNTSSTALVSTLPNVTAVGNDITLGQLYLRTTVAFRKFWPRVTLGMNGAVFPAASNAWYDFNGNGTYESTTALYLQGQECLVFFLGGIASPGADPSTGNTVIQGMTGFAKSPTNPFQNNLTTSGMYNANRNPPLFEFSAGRLAINTTTAPGMPYYLDSINFSASQNQGPTGFYAYFSTNNGTGYDPNDINIIETDSDGLSSLTLTFQTNQGSTTSLSPNPYTSSLPSGVPSVQYQAPQSFQIISSGVDGVFGVGGAYNPNSTSGSALVDESALSTTPTATFPTLDRTIEQDNLTNFRNGTLQ